MDLHFDRSCDGCTMCCQGWLWGEAHGYSFCAGKPCHFLGEHRCSIYEQRPDNPCKSYKCAWLTDSFLPQWFKPNISNVICTWRNWKENESYLEVIECEKKMDSSILSWLFIQHVNGNLKNFTYKLDGGTYTIGTHKFLNHMEVKKDDI